MLSQPCMYGLEKWESLSYFWQLISILIGIGAYNHVILSVTSPVVRRHSIVYRNMFLVIQLISKPLINHLVKFRFAHPLHSALSLASAFINICKYPLLSHKIGKFNLRYHFKYYYYWVTVAAIAVCSR